MAYRGRLIFPMIARLARLDTIASVTDDDFREAVRIDDGSPGGAAARIEAELIEIPAQVEDQDWESLSMEGTGNDPTTTVMLVFHLLDLERLEYVDPTTGKVTCPIVGDRLDAIIDPRSGAVEQMAPDPGLYCVHAQPRSYGLGARRRNLIVATFSERGKSTRR